MSAERSSGSGGVRGPVDLTLPELLRAVQASILLANEAVTSAQESHLADFFITEYGQTRARTIAVPMPGPDGGTVVRDVPLFALVPHNQLVMEKLSIELYATLERRTGEGASRLGVRLGPAPGDGAQCAKIEITFQRAEVPEGIARINNEIVKFI